MTILQNIDTLIVLIPTVLLYIVPGFVFLWLYNRLHDRTLPQDYLLYAIFISYIFTLVTKNPVYCILLSVGCSVLIYLLSRCSRIKKIMRFLFGFTPSRNIIDDVIDYDMGTYIYIKTAEWIFSGIYVGENHDNGTVLLSQYLLYDKDGTVVEDNKKSIAAVPLNRIEYIDYSYPKESKLIDYWFKNKKSKEEKENKE